MSSGLIHAVVEAGRWLLDTPWAAAALLLISAAGWLGLALTGEPGGGRRWLAASLSVAFMGQALISLSHYAAGMLLHGAAAGLLAAALFLPPRGSGTSAAELPLPAGEAGQAARAGQPGRGRFRQWAAGVAPAALLVAALALRLYQLDAASPKINDTTARTSLAAIQLLDRGLPRHAWRLSPGTLFHSRQSPIYVATMAAWIRVTGQPLTAARVTDVAWAIGSLLVAYWLFRRLWGRPAALVGLALLTVCRWHATLSRAGSYLMATVCFATLLMLLLLSLIQRPRLWKYPALGAAIAASSYFYSAIRPLAVVALLMAMTPLARGPRRLRAAFGLALLAGALCLAAWPQWPGWKPFRRDYFFQRAGSPPDVAVWAKTADGRAVRNAVDPAAALANLTRNLNKMLEIFFADGSVGPVHSALLLPGALLLARGGLASRLVLLWGLVGLAPGLLVAPPSRRMILVIPVLAAGSAAALVTAASGPGRLLRRRAALALAAAPLLALAAADVAAPFTDLRYRHVRDAAYGHPHRDRFGWALRETVEIAPVLVLESKPDRPVLDLIRFGVRRRDGQRVECQYVAEEEFLAWINDPGTSRNVALAFLCGADAQRDGMLLEAIAKRWPRAPVLEGAWSGSWDRIAFRIVFPWGARPGGTVLPSGPWDPVRVVTARKAHADGSRPRGKNERAQPRRTNNGAGQPKVRSNRARGAAPSDLPAPSRPANRPG